jgi:hypothetical protein
MSTTLVVKAPFGAYSKGAIITAPAAVAAALKSNPKSVVRRTYAPVLPPAANPTPTRTPEG